MISNGTILTNERLQSSNIMNGIYFLSYRNDPEVDSHMIESDRIMDRK
jgi:hypothetical protein